MKKAIIKIIAAAMAFAMLAMMMVGCAGGNKMTVKVTVKLGEDYVNFKYAEATAKGDSEFIIPQADRTMLDSQEVEIIYDDDEQISALRALSEVCANHDIGLTTQDDDSSVGAIKTYAGESYIASSGTHVEGYDENITFYWSYTINGKEPQNGRASSNYVKDGDTLVFTLTGTGK